MAGTDAADGTLCDRGMMTRDICLMGSCAESQCGDGYVDMGASPAEACDDGNLTAGDGCEPDCTVTGSTAPTAFRVQTLDLIHPHIYADLFIVGCTDVTDSVPIGEPVNTTLQNSVDDYSLNYITVHRPLDLSMTTNPIDLVDGECMAGATASDPDVCQVGTSGTVFPYVGTNMGAGMTCFTPDSSRYNYSDPNTVSGPCFVTDVRDLSVTVSGIDIPLLDAQVAATYTNGLPPTELTSGVITGFLTVADAMAAIIPDGDFAGDTLYEHLAHGGAPGSSCSTNDDSSTHTPTSTGTSTEGFWFFLNFTSTEADWVGP